MDLVARLLPANIITKVLMLGFRHPIISLKPPLTCAIFLKQTQKLCRNTRLIRQGLAQLVIIWRYNFSREDIREWH